MTTTRLGLCFPPMLAPQVLKPLATAAADAGLDEFWVWEDCFKESGIACAAAVLAWTERIRVGIGLMPAPLRNAGLTAMEIATLDRIFPGRLIPGIGHGVQSWMEQAGVRAASPLTLLREYAGAVRSLLAGERVTTAGTYVTLDDVVLDWPPLEALPLMIGGAGPKSLRLAGELGDGVLLSGTLTYSQVEQNCALVREGRAAGPHAGSPPDITVTLIAATGPEAVRRAAAEAAAWNVEPGDGVSAAGDADDIAAVVRRLAQAGASAVIIQPTRDDPDPGRLAMVLGDVKQRLAGFEALS